MIYNSIDTIPAKLYFKILDTGNLKMLSEKEVEHSTLELAWNKIEEEYNEISFDKTQNKILNLSKQIEGLASKYQAINLSVHYLRNIKDDDLVELLKTYGFKFNWSNTKRGIINEKISEEIYQNDLDKIERESKAIEVRVARIQSRMPIPKKSKNKGTFDENVMAYSAFTEMGFIDTNKITLSQYHSLIANGNKKIKALESGKRKNK